MSAMLLRLLAIAVLLASSTPGLAQTVLKTLGDNTHGQRTVPAGLNGVVAVAAGGNHSLALKADGTVAAWGYWNLNDHGQSTVPAGLTGVVAIAAGSAHSLALRADGTVVAWGWSGGPPTVPAPAGLAGVVSIAAGGGHSLALKADGTVVAWGGNFYGQCNVPAGLNGVVAISGGNGHSLALKADGTVVAWGFGDSGATTVPQGLTGVVAIASGTTHCLALKAAGTVVAWGALQNNVGQTTVPAGLTGVVAVTAGATYSLALKADGTVTAWGDNSYGQSTPPPDFTGITAVAASAASRHWLALNGVSSGAPVITSSRRWITEAAGARAGTVVFSQRIMATRSPTAFTATGLPDGLTLNAATGEISGTATQVGTFAVAVSASNAEGTGTATMQLVVTGTPFFLPPLPGPVEPGESAQLFAVGSFAATGLPQGMQLNASTGLITGLARPGLYNVSLTVSNPYGSMTIPWALEIPAVSAWGWNAAVPAGLTAAVGIAAGNSYSLALKAGGTVVAWGTNNAVVGTMPGSLTGVVEIAAGDSHALALKANGTVAAWGGNTYGQSTVPAGLTNVMGIAAGAAHSLALSANGTVVAWGDNSLGQSAMPAGLTGVVAIAAGSYSSLALKVDGTVVAWGSNSGGQRNVPAGLTGVAAIAAGDFHALALRANGTVVAWGYNGEGQSTVPAGLAEVAAIAAGNRHSLALKTDGTVVAWGYNTSGQSTAPPGLAKVTAIAAGYDHSMALVRFPAVPVLGTAGQALSVAYLPPMAVAQFAATGLPPGMSINAATGVISGMPVMPGTWNAAITMNNQVQTRMERLNFSILPAPEAYTAWVAAHWPNGGPASAAGADPDMDGVTNLFEYTTGSNPLAADGARLPITGSDASGRLTLTLDVPSDRLGLVVWHARFANSPVFFGSVTAAPVTVPGAPPGIVRLRFIDPQSPASPRRFGWLSATVP
jgi:alpha-tubulin suppressor-like RCC1 family protein